VDTTPEQAAARRIRWWQNCLGAFVLLTTLGIIGSYIAAVRYLGVRHDEGWIDSSRRKIAPIVKPTVADNGFDTYREAVRAIEVARLRAPAVPKLAPLPRGSLGPMPVGMAPSTWGQLVSEIACGKRDAADAGPLLAVHARPLALLHRAADQPYVAPVDPDVYSDPWYEAGFRELAHLAEASVSCLHSRSDDAAALALCRDLHAFGVNVPQWGGFEERLCGADISRIAAPTCLRVLESSRLPARHYRAHGRYLRALRTRAHPVGQSLRYHFSSAERLVALMPREGIEFVMPRCGCGPGAHAEEPRTRTDIAKFRIWLALWEPRESLEWVEDRIARMADMADAGCSPRAAQRFDDRTMADIGARNDLFASAAMVGLQPVLTKHRAVLSDLLVGEAVACLAAHRAEHGHYPDTLAALVPGYMAELPLDPRDGTPLRYERTAGGYRLWRWGSRAFAPVMGAPMEPTSSVPSPKERP